MKRDNQYEDSVGSMDRHEPQDDKKSKDIRNTEYDKAQEKKPIDDEISEDMLQNVSDRIIRDFDESLIEDEQSSNEGKVSFIEDEESSNEPDEEKPSSEDSQVPKKRLSKKKKVLIAIGSVCLSLLLIAIVLVGTPWGRKTLINWGIRAFSPRLDVVVADQNEDLVLFTAPTIEPRPTVTGEQNLPEDLSEPIASPYRKEAYVANFLLIGIEEIGGGARSDSMMIASVNIKDNTIKLTSIMRDSYVAIEGHGKNKLNAAYSFGEEKLLIDTIQKNFNISIDGYATVSFNNFEKIVDLLGGVDIELGKSEANYLNTKNYISDVSQRKVKAGWNTLTGNQALGYARVRYATTLGGETNDQGRTLRQRKLLNAIFDKYKSKGIFDLLSIMYDILPMIKTNLTETQMSDLLEQIVENKITHIDSYRIPAEGCYDNAKNECGAVLILDLDANIQKLYQYIFLDEPTNPTEN